jgi:hypothetical protein
MVCSKNIIRKVALQTATVAAGVMFGGMFRCSGQAEAEVTKLFNWHCLNHRVQLLASNE